MEIIAGENFIWVFELKNNDNSALALASLSSAKRNRRKVFANLCFPWRVHSDCSKKNRDCV